MALPQTRTQSPRDSWQFIAACLLAIGLMVVDEQTRLMSQVRMVLATAMLPLEWLARQPETWLDMGNRAVTDRAQLVQDNERLRMQTLLLSQQLQDMKRLEQENDRLRMLLGVASQIPRGKLLVAMVVDHSPDPFRQLLRLNKGSADGVGVGQSVVDANGLMGQIVAVNPLESDLLLVTDLELQIPVRVRRTGARGILQGDGGSEMSLRFLPITASLREGDLLETSGLDKRYPPGLPVAEVVSVTSQAGSVFWQVKAQPLSHPDTSREVLVLVQPLELPSLTQPQETSP